VSPTQQGGLIVALDWASGAHMTNNYSTETIGAVPTIVPMFAKRYTATMAKAGNGCAIAMHAILKTIIARPGRL